MSTSRKNASPTNPGGDSVGYQVAQLIEEFRAGNRKFRRCFVACMVPAWIGTWTAFVLVLVKF
jgi:hypothetical protein